MTQWSVRVSGVVQGVGFRPFVHQLAASCGLHGWVRNDSAGVEMVLGGQEEDFSRFVGRLPREAPPLAHILTLDWAPLAAEIDLPAGLEIVESQRRAASRTLVSPDVATCPACLQEICDPTDRRGGYAFTNCTHCGPRFTIIEDLPYDRPLTTMAGFELCSDCAAEYHNPHDRRFHAQPVACPTCGPQLSLLTGEGQVLLVDDPLAGAAAALREGKVVAVKGLGGFHLACLAEDEVAISRLREVKRRPAKPLAIMVANLDAAAGFAEISPTAAQLLQSPAAPIVLLPKCPRSSPPWLERAAPQNSLIGVMLPYTPLHHLLLEKVGRPLVMTSGNRRGEPLWTTEEEIDVACDAILTHNRPIARRCDDSLFVTGPDGRSQPVRRSRGVVPLPTMLPASLTLPQPGLAAGADLKNVGAIGVERQVFLTQHIGHLDHPRSRRLLLDTLADFERMFRVEAEWVAADLHPGYVSSRLAEELAAAKGVPLLRVQHHHAHLAGCLAENDHLTEAIGLCFDGTGYGTDGHIWGGEMLIASPSRFERRAHLQYLPLPGGDAAVRFPYRTAAAYLHYLLPHIDPGEILPEVDPLELANVGRLVDRQLSCPLTSSMGRLFDAAAALLGLVREATFEAQAPIALEAAARAAMAHYDPQEAGRYEFEIEEGKVALAQTLTGLVEDRRRRVGIGHSALKFHNTIAELCLSLARLGGAQTGLRTVALSGGVWQNQLLCALTVPLLTVEGFTVLQHRQVPPNDGGIAFGQIAIAAARAGMMTGG